MIKKFSELMPGDRVLFVDQAACKTWKAMCIEPPILITKRDKMMGKFMSSSYSYYISRDRNFLVSVYAMGENQ